jgi:hypothetical protein
MVETRRSVMMIIGAMILKLCEVEIFLETIYIIRTTTENDLLTAGRINSLFPV